MDIVYQIPAVIGKLSLIPDSNLIKSITFFAALLLIFAGIALLFFSKYSDSTLIKRIKESMMVRITISVIIGLIAWFLPWTSTKILLLLVASSVFFSIFAVKRRIGTLKAVLIGLLIFVAVLVIILAPLYAYHTNIRINNLAIPEISMESILDHDFEKNRILPDSEMSLENIESITIDADSGIQLEFTDGDILHYPSKLSVKEADGNLTISSTDFNAMDTYVIEMGTYKPRNLHIHCNGIKIRGKGNLKDFSLDCAGASINSDILSENNLFIDCSGLDMNGSMKGKILDIDSVGANIRGEIHSSEISLSSTGININLKATFDSFDISSSGLKGVIEVLNPQTQSAVLHIQATGGALSVSSKNNAPVKIESTGFVKIDRK